jgi:hypothetical protein
VEHHRAVPAEEGLEGRLVLPRDEPAQLFGVRRVGVLARGREGSDLLEVRIQSWRGHGLFAPQKASSL